MTDEQRNRVHDITYSTDDREELAERIVALEELCADIWCELDAATQYDSGGGRGIVAEFASRMEELGVPR